jgi:acyl carrier protein
LNRGHSEDLTITNEENAIRGTVRRFVLSSVQITDLSDLDDLFETGIVNSLFAVQLMTFIEKTFHIEVSADDLDIENFKSIEATSRYVMKKAGRVPV